MFRMCERLDSEAVDEDCHPNVVDDKTFNEKRNFFNSGEGSAELYHCVKLELILVRIPVNGNHPENHEENGQTSE